MKKSRIALLLTALGFCTTVHAQSPVTLYGIIDAGLMYTNNVSKSGTS